MIDLEKRVDTVLLILSYTLKMDSYFILYKIIIIVNNNLSVEAKERLLTGI